MKEETITNESSRKITTTYTLENNYRVKVSTYHYANAKAIRSILSECITGTSGIFTMETFAMFRDLNELVSQESVSRYSFKALEAHHAKAIGLASHKVAELLAQGEANQRECQVERVA